MTELKRSWFSVRWEERVWRFEEMILVWVWREGLSFLSFCLCDV